ncbi:transglycosylase [Psychromicrobium xiongbiense]|uniref:aggregation-promoting factor C-terminal-like domain-containing protein n=1 Tax=Psychromicrobium xiongbiense TaxID=3051184 RepID=UPI002553265B|nr:transglycosylase [Psychromicrobium sp. YIM S02556]
MTALVAALVLPGLSAVPARADGDTPPSGYPSWADVQQAKQNAASTAAETDRITALLGQLTTKAAQLGDAAVTASKTYAETKIALDAATARTAEIAQQSDAAARTSEQLRQEAASLAVQAYKNGGTGLQSLAVLGDLGSSEGLHQASLLGYVTRDTSNLLVKTQAAQRYTDALKQQLQASQDERSRLESQARTQLDAAAAAQKAAEVEVSTQQSAHDTLVSQLASLNNVAATTDAKYQQGVQAQREYEAAQQAKAAAAAAAAEQQRQQQEAARAAHNAAQQGSGGSGGNSGGSGGGGYTPPPVVSPPIPGGAVNDPAGAQAYAQANLGAFGWGQDQFGCLLQLWNRESSWLTNATNPSSGAYGIPQSLPASKMGQTGSDWLTNYRTQINWGLNYILGRYGSPCGAWAHEVSSGWY